MTSFLCCQVNIKGKHGRTPLYIAAEGGHVFIVKCLLAHPNIEVNCRWDFIKISSRYASVVTVFVSGTLLGAPLL